MVRRKRANGMAILFNQVKLGAIDLSSYFIRKSKRSVFYSREKLISNIRLEATFNKLKELINKKIKRIIRKINRLNVIFVKITDQITNKKVFEQKYYKQTLIQRGFVYISSINIFWNRKKRFHYSIWSGEYGLRKKEQCMSRKYTSCFVDKNNSSFLSNCYHRIFNNLFFANFSRGPPIHSHR